MTIFIRNSPKGLSGTQAKQSGRFINDTRPLDVCTLFLSLLAKPFICVFCSLWSKVLIFLNIQSQSETHVWFSTGATSYENLCTVNSVLHDSFKEACHACALLQDDREWLLCLEEATHFAMGYQLCHLFIIILIYCAPVDPHWLWEASKEYLYDDLCHQLIHDHHILEPTQDQSMTMVYIS
jgi:hypothetical protein